MPGPISWLKSTVSRVARLFSPSEAITPAAVEQTLAKGIGNPSKVGAVQTTLGGRNQGWWASDHYEEALHNTSWNYIFVHGKAVQAMQASVKVCRKVNRPKKRKMVQKSISTPEGDEIEKIPVPHDHPLLHLLENPNPKFSGAAFRYQIIQQMSLTGQALILIINNQLDDPCQLWVVPTAIARAQPPSPEYPEGAYQLVALGGYTDSAYVSAGLGMMAGLVIDARHFIRVLWPHSVYLGDSQSPLAACSLMIDIADELDRATWQAFRKGVNPSLVLSIDPSMSLSDPMLQDAREQVQSKFGGTENTGKAMILQGVTATQISKSATDLDYVSGRNQSRDTIGAIHRMAPIAVGISEAGSYSAYYAAMLQSTELGLQPELSLVSSALNMSLAPRFGDDLEISMDAKSIQDPQLIQQQLSLSIQAKAITINEFRAKIGQPPVPWGDVQIGQADSNLQQPGVQGDPTGKPGDDSKPAEAEAGDETDTGTEQPGLDDMADLEAMFSKGSPKYRKKDKLKASSKGFGGGGQHAPKGGVTVGGTEYKGGQFIPAEVIAKATDEEKAAIRGGGDDSEGQAKGKPKKKTARDEWQERVDARSNKREAVESIASGINQNPIDLEKLGKLNDEMYFSRDFSGLPEAIAAISEDLGKHFAGEIEKLKEHTDAKNLKPLESIAEKAGKVVGKAATKYQSMLVQIVDTKAKLKELQESPLDIPPEPEGWDEIPEPEYPDEPEEPEEPELPDEPEKPIRDQYDDEQEYQKDMADYESSMKTYESDREGAISNHFQNQAYYESAMEEYHSAVNNYEKDVADVLKKNKQAEEKYYKDMDKWEAIKDKATEKREAQVEKLEEKVSDLESDARDHFESELSGKIEEFLNDFSDEHAGVTNDILSDIDDEEAKDDEPEEEEFEKEDKPSRKESRREEIRAENQKKNELRIKRAKRITAQALKSASHEAMKPAIKELGSLLAKVATAKSKKEIEFDLKSSVKKVKESAKAEVAKSASDVPDLVEKYISPQLRKITEKAVAMVAKGVGESLSNVVDSAHSSIDFDGSLPSDKKRSYESVKDELTWLVNNKDGMYDHLDTVESDVQDYVMDAIEQSGYPYELGEADSFSSIEEAANFAREQRGREFPPKPNETLESYVDRLGDDLYSWRESVTRRICGTIFDRVEPRWREIGNERIEGSNNK